MSWLFIFLGALSGCSLYLLWRTPPQQDAVSIWARALVTNRMFSFSEL
ncbi:hypothetical protein [Flavobacterium sp. GSP27]|nr:hypothetical protein [Flavobacterium sp. GSP27]